MKEFLTWISDNYKNDVYFMSSKDLVEYMKNPFDKTGNPVSKDEIHTPTCTRFFNLVGDLVLDRDQLGSDVSYVKNSGSSITVDFTIGTNDEVNGNYVYASVSGYFKKGAMQNVSHIDIEYEAEQPVRIVLVPDTGSAVLPLEVLLAGIGGPRKARIRMKDFGPSPYQPAAEIEGQDFVDEDYLKEIVGITFDSATTEDQLNHQFKINKLLFRGMPNSDIAY
jgi:hypothetical protein